MNDQQGFVVGVCSRGRPIEAPRDHGFVVDHSELVVELVAAGEAGGADSSKGLLQGLIASFNLAGVIWKGDAQQIENFREGAACKPRICDQTDLNASLDLIPQCIG